MRLNLFFLFALSAMFFECSAMANSGYELNCKVSVDGIKVFDDHVEVDHEERAPEGSGSKVFFQDKGFQVFVEKYPVMMTIQVLNSNGNVVGAIKNYQIVQAWQFITSDGGKAARIRSTLSDDTFGGARNVDAQCKESR